ncbi:vesicular mannose-binding lectin [Anaeramoeba flamelloides]|uniref:Vesicular mannose-binding lectin n=1 Tax=Anaeramoeba flamelloides TaxID=1746091 RepID=A0AAV7ZCD6_9EUKA|nr:vesicular mannose-binding lectin [Anaeramoeba flamelloides]KAJ6244299.1 vesicular mannose-binding lectin [Anaeramoeba flamelloides]
MNDEWETKGSTELKNDRIRLTPDNPNKKGHLWSKKPNKVKNWEIEIVFNIHGNGKYGADGLAIWYTKHKLIDGQVFGSRNHFSGLGVFLDTYDNNGNNDNPFVQAMIGNGILEYEGDVDGITSSIGQCSVDFRNLQEDSSILIRYEDKKLIIKTRIGTSKSYSKCVYQENVELPLDYHFGVTAKTGSIHDYHDLIKFIVKDLDKDKTEITELDKKKEEEYIEKKSSIYKTHKEIQQELNSLLNEKNDLFEFTQKEDPENEVLKFLTHVTTQNKKLNTILENIFDFTNYHAKNQPTGTELHLILQDLEKEMLQNGEEIFSIEKQLNKLSNFFEEDVVSKHEYLVGTLETLQNSIDDFHFLIKQQKIGHESLKGEWNRETKNINYEVSKKSHLAFWIFCIVCQFLLAIFIWYYKYEQKQKIKVL